MAQAASWTLPMLTPAQIRAARAMLDWTQGELAKRAGISKTGLNNIERGSADPKASTLTAIRRAIEDAGVEFTKWRRAGCEAQAHGTTGPPDLLLHAGLITHREDAERQKVIATAVTKAVGHFCEARSEKLRK